MDNQHRRITGYRELSAAEIELMNEIKEQGEVVGQLVCKLRSEDLLEQVLGGKNAPPLIDQRWVSIGVTHLQEGFMALTRAVAKPTSF